MLAEQVILGAIAALAVGGTATWWLVTRQLTRRFEARVQRTVTVMRRQHEAVVDKLHMAHDVEKKAHERQPGGAARHTVSEEQRAAMSRLEERLSVAYAELDKLRLQVNGPATSTKLTPADAFAPTQVLQRPVARAAAVSRPAVRPEQVEGFAATMPYDPDL